MTNEDVAVATLRGNADPLFQNRWSPRSLAPTSISREQIETIVDAARRAPSQQNTQPWRFAVATRGSGRDLLNEAIRPSNRVWCDSAPVLMVVLALLPEEEVDHELAIFDTGSAWISMAYQAEMLGLRAHAMGGIDRDQVRTVLGLDAASVFVACIVAIGYQGAAESLTPGLQAREVPKERLAVDEVLTWL